MRDMHFIPEEIEDYVIRHSAAEPELLQQLSRETYQKVLQPRMLSGHYQGRLLSIISKIIRPKNILEIGTYTGYSALCLAEGLDKEGQLHTIDLNEELYDLQRKYFSQSEYSNQIIQHLGNATEIIPNLDMHFDLVFIDADKPNYPKYLELILDKLNSGGVLLSDNVLWSGKVVQNIRQEDESTIALQEYNKKLAQHKSFETLMLPIRDGLTISRKK